MCCTTRSLPSGGGCGCPGGFDLLSLCPFGRHRGHLFRGWYPPPVKFTARQILQSAQAIYPGAACAVSRDVELLRDDSVVFDLAFFAGWPAWSEDLGREVDVLALGEFNIDLMNAPSARYTWRVSLSVSDIALRQAIILSAHVWVR